MFWFNYFISAIALDAALEQTLDVCTHIWPIAYLTGSQR